MYEEGQFPSVLVSDIETEALPQLSVAVNVAAAGIAEHSTVLFTGKLPTNAGAVVSWTFIVWTWTAVFPQRSVAV